MPPVPRLQISDRRAAAARRRRRRGRMRLAGLIIALVLVVLIIADTAGGSSHTTGTRTSAVNHARTRPATSTSARTTSPTDPLTTAQMKRLLARRGDQVSAAVYDIRTGQEWTLKPGLRNQTASIVKADILETLLYQDRDDLDDAETDTAQDMIEASDNDDASDLYTAIGGPSGLDAYDARIGMKRTTGGEDGYWGETLTTSPDQITLLKQLSLPGSVLPAAAVHYQLSLMENIDPGENWGVTGGVPSSGVTVALKNGWVPLTSNADWEVNSIGWVDGDKHDYLIAVMTAHDSSEDYGINTIDAMSKLIYDTIGPAPSAGTKTITVTPTG
jgi:hypothetical protein